MPTNKRAIKTKAKILLDDSKVEIRFNDNGTIDEIVTHAPVHVTYEYIDKDSVHLMIGNVRVAIGARIPKNRKRPVIRTGVEDWSANPSDLASYGELDD